ncbi:MULTISPECIES: YihY/virulence factor BrkB family protein [unclassified Coleofasciculus]|uniref:YihY/virulence factor BrkB family protein n=1 Tax=unclassified Coleofasciculus TaxID=2692782 RepID=UPI0018828262|nr:MULTISPECIES: YihY/virulence factor BrkB family protein [unclassified Coleofasciculus]MBE9129449.1 YihY/virulence factor BrkB family protein [Coleofasciculus sp. LEGE 07081]MBE9149655.1 YihY/virulence factor BrkB family protein [Coleofasciculus sp. LEGE 07092]
MKPKVIVELLKETFGEWQEDKASRLAASLAYYTVFSLAPLLIIAIAIVGAIFGEEAAKGEIVGQIQGLVGNEGAQAIEAAIKNANQPNVSSVASLISVFVLLFGASGVFAQLQDALNTIWEVRVKPGRGIKGFIKKRLLSFGAVLGIGFLLLVSLVLSAVLSALSHMMSGLIPGAEWLWQILNFVISFGVVTLLFAMMYKFLPDVKIAWDDVWIGAIITALLFTVGKFALGFYLGQGSFGSTYGAAGSLVIILAWVYYSAQILFFGAEFTQVYARRYGSKIEPDENAEPIPEAARAKQGMSRRR